MIRYCTCYIEYLFRVDVTDCRDRIGESLRSAVLPVFLPDAKIHLYTLVNNSDISSHLLRDGGKKSEDRCQESAVITKELQSQGKNCSNFLSRNEWIHLPPRVCDSLKCFHSTRHKIMSMNNPPSVRRSSLCWLFQMRCIAHGSDTAFVYAGHSKSFPSANVTTGHILCSRTLPVDLWGILNPLQILSTEVSLPSANEQKYLSFSCEGSW